MKFISMWWIRFSKHRNTIHVWIGDKRLLSIVQYSSLLFNSDPIYQTMSILKHTRIVGKCGHSDCDVNCLVRYTPIETCYCNWLTACILITNLLLNQSHAEVNKHGWQYVFSATHIPLAVRLQSHPARHYIIMWKHSAWISSSCNWISLARPFTMILLLTLYDVCLCSITNFIMFIYMG